MTHGRTDWIYRRTDWRNWLTDRRYRRADRWERLADRRNWLADRRNWRADRRDWLANRRHRRRNWWPRVRRGEYWVFDRCGDRRRSRSNSVKSGNRERERDDGLLGPSRAGGSAVTSLIRNSDTSDDGRGKRR